jgi:hypothetical protein
LDKRSTSSRALAAAARSRSTSSLVVDMESVMDEEVEDEMIDGRSFGWFVIGVIILRLFMSWTDPKACVRVIKLPNIKTFGIMVVDHIFLTIS